MKSFVIESIISKNREELVNYIISLDSNDDLDKLIKEKLFYGVFDSWANKLDGNDWVEIFKSLSNECELEVKIKETLICEKNVILNLNRNDFMLFFNNLKLDHIMDGFILRRIFTDKKNFARLLEILTEYDWMRIILKLDFKNYSDLKKSLIVNIFNMLCLVLDKYYGKQNERYFQIDLCHLGENEEEASKMEKFLDDEISKKEKIQKEIDNMKKKYPFIDLLGYGFAYKDVDDGAYFKIRDNEGNLVGIVNSGKIFFNSINIFCDGKVFPSFYIKESNTNKISHAVELEEGYLKIISSSKEYGNIIFSCDDKNLFLSYATITKDNIFNEVKIDYSISTRRLSIRTSSSVSNNMDRKCNEEVFILYDNKGSLVERTAKFKYDKVVDENSQNLDGTFEEAVASNKELIGYVSDFFDLLREKVFPFFKGDIVSYLISEDILKRLFTNGELASKLVRTRKISN